MATQTSGRAQRLRRSRGGFILSVLLFVGLLCTSYFLFSLFYSFVNDEYSFPVSRIIIKGDLKYTSRIEVANTVGAIAGNKNLTSLDLAPVHNALVQMPWISKASVSKRYPDILEVELTEHFPSARWKQTGIYDAQNNSVFYPEQSDLHLPLVTLSAPHDSLAGELYEHASLFMQLTASTPYNIEEVQLDAARGYRVKLEGDVWLILGRESTTDLPLIRLKRFLLAFSQTGMSLDEIAYVDLRYDNGFAVGMREANDNAAANATNNNATPN